VIRHRPNKSGPAPESCPLEGSLKLLAGAWTPKILWYLRLEPRPVWGLKAGSWRNLGEGFDHASSGIREARCGDSNRHADFPPDGRVRVDGARRQAQPGFGRYRGSGQAIARAGFGRGQKGGFRGSAFRPLKNLA
jgi:hypothetical protein